MSNFPTVISFLALAVSAVSLTVSLLGYLRDRSKLRVWSTVSWQWNGPESDTPVLHIQIANLGRRPAVILNLVKRAGKTKWWRSVQRPELPGQETLSVKQLIELKRSSLAHLVSLKLNEGEIFELAFTPEDFHEFIATHDTPIVEATLLEIEDVFGKMYPVKDSTKNLAKFLKACHAENSRISEREPSYT